MAEMITGPASGTENKNNVTMNGHWHVVVADNKQNERTSERANERTSEIKLRKSELANKRIINKKTLTDKT